MMSDGNYLARLIHPLWNHGICDLLEIRTCRRKGIPIFKPVLIPKITYNVVQPLFLQEKIHRHWNLFFIKYPIFYGNVTLGYVITFCMCLRFWWHHRSGKSLNIVALKLFQNAFLPNVIITELQETRANKGLKLQSSSNFVKKATTLIPFHEFFYRWSGNFTKFYISCLFIIITIVLFIYLFILLLLLFFFFCRFPPHPGPVEATESKVKMHSHYQRNWWRL